jgi:hypothetical protein
MAGIDEQNEDWTAVDYLLFFSEDEPSKVAARPPADEMPPPAANPPLSHATEHEPPIPPPNAPAEHPARAGFLARVLAALRRLFAHR